eukprot:3251028-Alexandrium_andersonii.AAC.1
MPELRRPARLRLPRCSGLCSPRHLQRAGLLPRLRLRPLAATAVRAALAATAARAVRRRSAPCHRLLSRR